MSEVAKGGLAGRRAVVTGGGTGIGEQFARTLAEAGASVVICGRRLEPLQLAAEAIDDAGGEVIPVRADVTSEDDVHRLAAEAGAVDILVNNAGYGKRVPWTEVSLEEWREIMAVNVEAPLRLSQLFVPPMVERGWGRVVNISSVYGLVTGNPWFYPQMDWDSAAYVTSKHAVIGLTKYLAGRTAGTGVTVNAISPGMFPDTEANKRVSSDESRRRVCDFTPLGRTGDVVDLSTALIFLVSPGSSFVTGSNVVVDGGWTIW